MWFSIYVSVVLFMRHAVCPYASRFMQSGGCWLLRLAWPAISLHLHALHAASRLIDGSIDLDRDEQEGIIISGRRYDGGEARRARRRSSSSSSLLCCPYVPVPLLLRGVLSCVLFSVDVPHLHLLQRRPASSPSSSSYLLSRPHIVRRATADLSAFDLTPAAHLDPPRYNLALGGAPAPQPQQAHRPPLPRPAGVAAHAYYYEGQASRRLADADADADAAPPDFFQDTGGESTTTLNPAFSGDAPLVGGVAAAGFRRESAGHTSSS
jgi:hypothetical protein